ncbi:MAG: hypothetical protein K5851_06475 [Lachnospiraceae bacterium]|nr:hypothetical protein [Lachnospiraceae bacterium]
MNRFKRILALIGVFLLAFMYILTVFAAVFDDGKTMTFLKLSLVLTILVPSIIWIFGIFVRITKHDSNEESEEDK